ncbi:MAG: protein-glutamate methylesterase/protein-glutamine glutaminase [Cellvibrionaceae bacterium]
MKKVTVLIVDDSALIRNLLSEIINSNNFLEVVGTSADPYEAREKIKTLKPDVITLDVEMPRMDGITFLKNLMRLRPMPVLMISTLTEKGSDITLKALELGAVDYIAKPKVSVAEKLTELADDITTKIRIAAKANISAYSEHSQPVKVPTISSSRKKVMKDDVSLIAIGASTGGVEATKRLLSLLPKEMPPIVIVQHMPAGFTTSYAKRLDGYLDATVTEFSGQEKRLLPENVYIANGSQHLAVRTSAGRVLAYCQDSDPVNRHRPAVDVLFNSVAEFVKGQAIGVLLTGMGVDGAAGMSELEKTGAITIAQDEASSVVWGMPRVAIEQGAAKYTLSLDKIAPFLIERCYG